MTHILLPLLALLAALVPAALAGADPIRRQVGDYVLDVGYEHEPPYMEEKNSLLVEVRRATSGEPVSGLEGTLRAGVAITVTSAISREFALTLLPVPGQPGRYRAPLVPPITGDYTYHLRGTIEGMPVNESYASGKGALPRVIVHTGLDYRSPGAMLAVGVLAAYLIGLGAILIVMRRRRRRRDTLRARLHTNGARPAG